MSDAIQTLDASAAHANRKRHALALQVGRLTGAMKWALAYLDAGLSEDAANKLREALKAEEGR